MAVLYLVFARRKLYVHMRLEKRVLENAWNFFSSFMMIGWFLSAYFLGGYEEDGRGMNGLFKAVFAAAKSWAVGVPEFETGRCLRIWDLGDAIEEVAWNPLPALSILAVAVGYNVFLLNAIVGNDEENENIETFLHFEPQKATDDNDISASIVDWCQDDKHGGIRLKHFKVAYKHQLELDEKKKKALDMHLEFLIGQTERYSAMLAENHLSLGVGNNFHKRTSQSYPANGNVFRISLVATELQGGESVCRNNKEPILQPISI